MAWTGYRPTWRSESGAGRTMLEVVGWAAPRTPVRPRQDGGPAEVAVAWSPGTPARSGRAGVVRDRLVNSLRAFDAAVVWAALTAFCWYAFALVPIQLATADALGLGRQQASSLVFVVWCTAGVGTLAFALATRQPIALSMQFPALIYLSTLSDRFSFPQLMGGVFVAGLVVSVAGYVGIVGWVLRRIPPSIVMAVFVGSVFGVLTRAVAACGSDVLVAGSTVAGYAAGCILRWRLLPPIGMAALWGAVGTGLGGRLSAGTVAWAMPTPVLVAIEFDPSAIAATAVPMVVLSLLVAPRGVAVLAGQGYSVNADRLVTAIGVGTAANALFGGGPAGISSEGGAALAGDEAGPKERRYVAAVIAGVLMLGIAFLAEPLAGLLQGLPREYLTTLVGLAILRVVADGFQRMFGGPLRLAPLVTFVVATTSFTVAGIGSAVWALVAGLVVAVVVELPDLWTFWHESETPR